MKYLRRVAKRGRKIVEWKAQVSVRIRQTLWAEIEEFAAKERRTMSNISESFLEWVSPMDIHIWRQLWI